MATNKAEVVVLIKALNKAAASKEPAQNLVDILQRFKTEVKATDEVLRVSFPISIFSVSIYPNIPSP